MSQKKKHIGTTLAIGGYRVGFQNDVLCYYLCSHICLLKINDLWVDSFLGNFKHTQ